MGMMHVRRSLISMICKRKNAFRIYLETSRYSRRKKRVFKKRRKRSGRREKNWKKIKKHGYMI